MISIKDLKHDVTEAKVGQIQKNGLQSRGPSPNRGASVPDIKAAGQDQESQEAWRQTRGIDRSKQVKLTKVSHMRYQHPDLNVITTFLRDFGLTVTHRTETERWYRGYGPDPYVYYARQGPKQYLGGCFEVASYAELEKVTQIPGLTVTSNGIETIPSSIPGGGYFLTITDPDGFPLNFVYGQTPTPSTIPKPAKLVINDETDKPRQRAFQRYTPGPAAVHKLGHFGLNVSNFPAQMDWYTRHFNLSPSDILYIPTPTPTNPDARHEVALFAHIDLGQTLTDHHTMFLTTLAPNSTKEKHVHHASFEVHDFDTQLLGHKWLANKGYESVWGVGRHILGSQIFDYWWDTTGFMVEHYADGDLVNEETPVGYGLAEDEGLAVWGPEVPRTFLE